MHSIDLKPNMHLPREYMFVTVYMKCDAKLFMAYTWNVSQRNLQSLNLGKAHDVQLHSHEVIEYLQVTTPTHTCMQVMM